MTDPSGNGWIEYRKHVVSSLDANEKKLISIEKRLRVIENDITELKTKVYLGAGVLSLIVSTIMGVLIK